MSHSLNSRVKNLPKANNQRAIYKRTKQHLRTALYTRVFSLLFRLRSWPVGNNSFEYVFNFNSLAVLIRYYPGIFNAHFAHIFFESIRFPVIAEYTNGEFLRLVIFCFPPKVWIVVKILCKVFILKCA